jgi:asparagine synthase (glutamine-hydrolysing)
MCGIVGYIDMRRERPAEQSVVMNMADKVAHRGPDSHGYFVDGSMALGFRRLSIIDLSSGDQPITNEDGSVVLICNGEIYNYRELRRELQGKGHTFRTNTDVEVLVHLYEEEDVRFVNRLNGQFAFAIYDRKQQTLFLARDHFGINPLFYTVVDDVFIFASEIKAMLEHPLVQREVDLTGLDQVLSFPGLVSPRTMFKDVFSLKAGHYITIRNGNLQVAEYWDLDYPDKDAPELEHTEDYYVEGLSDLFAQSVRYRLQSDVPVGFYLSGGLDSSLIASMIKNVSSGVPRHSFSITFTDKEICEAKYQRMMAKQVSALHHEMIFDWSEIASRLPAMVYHAECPVKESYNTCSMALSEAARRNGIPVILTGEGADELFAGYVGYRFDQSGMRNGQNYGVETILEEEIREKLWGDPNLIYETDQFAFREIKQALYSDTVQEEFEDFECLNFDLVNHDRLRNRHFIHQRSYLDFKLRLSDHLIADHGDRMALANSVEARYPFLDINLVEFATKIPAHLKLNELSEKYILKKVAQNLIPDEVINREKFGFHAPGSPYLLKQGVEWVNDLLTEETIKRQGYFNPHSIMQLKSQYMQDGFRLNLPFENDLLMIVLTFNLLLEQFNLPDLN